MKKKDLKESIKFYGKYMSLAIQMFGILFIAALIGQWLDAKLETSRPLITALMIVVVLVGVLFKLIRDLDKK